MKLANKTHLLSNLLFPRKGTVMDQCKEPAISRSVKVICSEPTIIHNYKKVESPENLTAQQIIDLARDAEIIDEHENELLWAELVREMGTNAYILVDAMDDEPYVSSQIGPTLLFREECVSGLNMIKKVLGTDKADFLIYKNMTGIDSKIPNKICGIPVQKIGGSYPAEFNSNKFFKNDENTHYFIVGACSLIFLHRAVYYGQKQTSTFITVAGNCIGSPRNLEIDIGANADLAIDTCGLIDEPTRIICGGSLTGHSVSDTSKTIIDTSTRAILAFKEDERDQHYECIGCGRCIKSCPAGLNPMMIMRAMDSGHTELLQDLHMDECFNCMTCSYVCPAKLDIAQSISDYAQQKGEQE